MSEEEGRKKEKDISATNTNAGLIACLATDCSAKHQLFFRILYMVSFVRLRFSPCLPQCFL